MNTIKISKIIKMSVNIPVKISSSTFQDIIPFITQMSYSRVRGVGGPSTRYVATLSDACRIDCCHASNNPNASCRHRLPSDDIHVKAKVLDSDYYFELESLYKHWLNKGTILEQRQTTFDTYRVVGPKKDS